jgi:hypothetical protein
MSVSTKMVGVGLLLLLIGGVVAYNFTNGQIVDCGTGHCAEEFERIIQSTVPVFWRGEADLGYDEQDEQTSPAATRPPVDEGDGDEQPFCPQCPPGKKDCEAVCPPIVVTLTP